IFVVAESMFPDQSDFDYDYETLRTTGVILAVIMFVSGILIALTQNVDLVVVRCCLKVC
uniref:FXYD domain-containing ion transport regulator n=1 Tax=Nothobranchius furzeri TaxID=105023 RepID=A0A8C6KHM4_NOTFU